MQPFLSYTILKLNQNKKYSVFEGRLINNEQKTIKCWELENGDGKNFAVTVQIKEILDSPKKPGNSTIYLYYSSKEASKGRLLAGIVYANKNSVIGK